MAVTSTSEASELTREHVDAMTGPVVLEFGTGWCGHCQAAAPLFGLGLSAHPGVRHISIEDGRGKRLGRSFGVKLWPTFVFLRDGREITRLVRPRDEQAIHDAFAQIT